MSGCKIKIKNMEDLTQRQIDILNVIIKEYSESGMPVGSGVIEKKYKLGVCPATIRNEMVELAKKGYLKKEYFSSGRVPSAKGFRFYINNLMKEKELSTTDEVSFKNSVWDERSETHRLLSQAVKILSKKTGLLSLSATNNGDLYYSGVANIFTQPEFFDIGVSRNLLELIDEINYWERVLSRFSAEQELIYLLGEEDFHDPAFEPCASIIGNFEGQNTKGIIGVVGHRRMSYELVAPQVRYFSKLLEQIIREQKL